MYNIRNMNLNEVPVRRHGSTPYTVVVIHGGPGAAGEMTPVARVLAAKRGVLEPWQTADTLNGQIEELKTAIIRQADIPATLIGFSWGAWLGWMVAGRFPGLVKKLILIGAPPFTEPFAQQIEPNRMSRLAKAEQTEFTAIVSSLTGDESADPDSVLTRLGVLTRKTDSYDLLPDDGNLDDKIEVNADLFRKVWPEAAAMREDGRLISVGKRINCPVVAIHGEHDPHPVQGVEEPLRNILKKLRMTVLPKCGHTPWREKHAREAFFQFLETEIADDPK